MVKKTDLRILRTEKNLKNALLELLQEKDLRTISVSDIYIRAFCSRNTFYDHYANKEDLYEGIINETVSHIEGVFKPLVSGKAGVSEEIYEQCLINIIRGFNGDAAILSIILRQDTELFVKHVMKLISSEIEESLCSLVPYANHVEINMYNRYISAGMAGFIIEWLRHTDLSVSEAGIYLRTLHSGTMKSIAESFAGTIKQKPEQQEIEKL
jgi:AcrR family transcriptional regulator